MTYKLKNKLRRKQNKTYYTNYPKLVAISFLLVIIAGTILLMLPVSVKQGSVSFTDALFTATSATCVTGLVVYDTFTKWTLFGQLVILAMIQVGGLGFITIITLAARLLKKRATIKEKILFRESIGSIYTGDTKILGRRIVLGTILFEALGAVILSTQFIPMMNFKNGLYTAVFLSVSAFGNAGFDVMGRLEAGSSLINVNSNPVILITISALIIIGGIGFIVWDDLANNKFKLKRLSLHTKLTLTTTGILLFAGTIIYLVFEKDASLSGMSFGDKLLNAFFTSTTMRTAGFNTVPVSEMSSASKFLSFFLMLIGGSSGSTAGGIKTSTLAILFLCIAATLTNAKEVEAFGRRISNELVRKATAILFINFSLVLFSSVAIAVIQPQLDFYDILFECFSAVGTVGITVGITSKLTVLSRLIIVLMMYVGRLTSLTFVFVFRFNQNTKSIIKPMGDMLVG